jgi:hypothetical protein
MTPPGTTKRDLLDWLLIQAPGVAGSIREAWFA